MKERASSLHRRALRRSAQARLKAMSVDAVKMNDCWERRRLAAARRQEEPQITLKKREVDGWQAGTPALPVQRFAKPQGSH